MKPRVRQKSRRGSLEPIRDLLSLVPVPPDHQMYVIGKDAARVDHISGALHAVGKSFGHAKGLLPIEDHWSKDKRSLRSIAKGGVILTIRHAARGGDFGCGAESEQLPAANEVGPTAALVIWEPESVGGDDDVMRENHGFLEGPSPALRAGAKQGIRQR
jgi:hypothetical protein